MNDEHKHNEQELPEGEFRKVVRSELETYFKNKEPKTKSHVAKKSDRYCSDCGEDNPNYKEDSTKDCIECGENVETEQKYCTNCGEKDPARD
jgi:hypothetical protein